MAQVQTFPFTHLITPVDNRASRLTTAGEQSNISDASSTPETKAKTKVFNGQLYQETLLTSPNPYYGPDIVLGLPTTSSVALYGQQLDLDVVVRGYPINEFTFQWYQNGTAFNGASGYTITNNPSGSVLSISNVQPADNGDTYTLRITSPYNDPSVDPTTYAETSTYIYVNPSLYHPNVLFTIVGAIQ